MRINMSDAIVHLEGDWTLAGITLSAIESLSVALQQFEHGVAKRLQIDCRDVIAIDITGQQLLDVWMQCARLRGVEPELIT
jgi:ABC-type transporter Mla MlaB component